MNQFHEISEVISVQNLNENDCVLDPIENGLAGLSVIFPDSVFSMFHNIDMVNPVRLYLSVCSECFELSRHEDFCWSVEIIRATNEMGHILQEMPLTQNFFTPEMIQRLQQGKSYGVFDSFHELDYLLHKNDNNNNNVPDESKKKVNDKKIKLGKGGTRRVLEPPFSLQAILKAVDGYIFPCCSDSDYNPNNLFDFERREEKKIKCLKRVEYLLDNQIMTSIQTLILSNNTHFVSLSIQIFRLFLANPDKISRSNEILSIASRSVLPMLLFSLTTKKPIASNQFPHFTQLSIPEKEICVASFNMLPQISKDNFFSENHTTQNFLLNICTNLSDLYSIAVKSNRFDIVETILDILFLHFLPRLLTSPCQLSSVLEKNQKFPIGVFLAFCMNHGMYWQSGAFSIVIHREVQYTASANLQKKSVDEEHRENMFTLLNKISRETKPIVFVKKSLERGVLLLLNDYLKNELKILEVVEEWKNEEKVELSKIAMCTYLNQQEKEKRRVEEEILVVTNFCGRRNFETFTLSNALKNIESKVSGSMLLLTLISGVMARDGHGNSEILELARKGGFLDGSSAYFGIMEVLLRCFWLGLHSILCNVNKKYRGWDPVLTKESAECLGNLFPSSLSPGSHHTYSSLSTSHSDFVEEQPLNTFPSINSNNSLSSLWMSPSFPSKSNNLLRESSASKVLNWEMRRFGRTLLRIIENGKKRMERHHAELVTMEVRKVGRSGGDKGEEGGNGCEKVWVNHGDEDEDGWIDAIIFADTFVSCMETVLQKL